MADIGNSQLRRAWVLDTDLGHDPDDVIALTLLYKHAVARSEPLAVVTSAEVDSAVGTRVTDERAGGAKTAGNVYCRPDQKNHRARVVRWLLRGLGDAGDAVTVAAGSTMNAFGQGMAAGLEQLVTGAPNAATGAIGTLDDIAAFIARHRSEGLDVTWIGIGSSSNLASLLEGPGLSAEARVLHLSLPSRVFAMFGCFPDGYQDVETNVRFDPAATQTVLRRCADIQLPLSIVSLDTTGFGLSWLCPHSTAPDVPEVQQLLSALDSLGAARECVQRNTQGPAPCYSGTSALHDPLTVLLAIDSAPCPCPACPWALSLFSPAHVELSDAGVVRRVFVDAAALATRRALADRTLQPLFWSQGPPYEEEEGGAGAGAWRGACSLALGPLTGDERASLAGRMRDLLTLPRP